ncbi:MAG: hypothetical protein ACK4OO_08335, partial [bacterium]
YHLWAGGWGAATIRIYDDGIQEAYWFSYNPRSGVLAGGEDMGIEVTFNAAGLVEGDYEAELHFLSNDPENSDVAVALLLHVQGAPDIGVSWPEDWGYPDVVDWNRRYAPDFFSGGPYPMTLRVTNGGTTDLVVEGIEVDHDYFSVEPVEFALGPQESQDVVITFEAPADDADEVNATLTIFSNDPDEGEWSVALHADPAFPPAIVIDPMSIEDDLVTGARSEHVINVANEGDALLRGRIRHEIIREPEMDRGARSLRSVDGSGPRRDDAGDLIAQFNQPQGGGANIYCSPVAWDWEN